MCMYYMRSSNTIPDDDKSHKHRHYYCIEMHIVRHALFISQTNVACVKRLSPNWNLFCFFYFFHFQFLFSAWKAFASILLSIHSCKKASDEKFSLDKLLFIENGIVCTWALSMLLFVVFFIHTQILRGILFSFSLSKILKLQTLTSCSINSHWIWIFAVCILISIWNEWNCV